MSSWHQRPGPQSFTRCRQVQVLGEEGGNEWQEPEATETISSLAFLSLSLSLSPPPSLPRSLARSLALSLSLSLPPPPSLNSLSFLSFSSEAGPVCQRSVPAAAADGACPTYNAGACGNR